MSGEDKDTTQTSRFAKGRLCPRHTTIFVVSIFIYILLLAAALSLYRAGLDSKQDEKRSSALQLAHHIGEKISSVLEKSILPLYSLAQLAIELDILRELYDKVGEIGGPQSLPAMFNEENDEVYRNVTGICDQPELIERYSQIVRTMKRNLDMNGVLRNLQLNPYGVACLSDGNLNAHWLGLDILNSPKYRTGIIKTTEQDDIILFGPFSLAQSCPENEVCGLGFVARYPVRSEYHEIVVDSSNTIPNRWGLASVILDWDALVAKSEIHQYAEDRGYSVQIVRTDETYNVKTFTTEEAVTVLTQSENYGKMERTVSTTAHTANDIWIINIQYDDHKHFTNLFVSLSVVAPFLVAALVYVLLLQKQLQTTIRGDALAEKAKVVVERNMTAYFAHELRNPLSAIDSALSSMPDDLPTEAMELLKGMQLCSSFMSQIMNNLLDVRKMEEGKMTLQNSPLSLGLLVNDVQKMTLPAAASGVEVKAVVETGDHDWVFGDVHRLKQVRYAHFIAFSSESLCIQWLTTFSRFDSLAEMVGPE